MRHLKQEASCSSEQGIDLISAVKKFHRLSSQELGKLLRDSENFTLQCFTEKGSSIQIDMDKLARFLPLHLIAVLMSSERDEPLFRYLLCGFRLLHSLCDLAPRHTKLEQILLDDVKVSEHLLDLVLYLLIVLGGHIQENNASSLVPLLHSGLVACSLNLLTGCISSQWQDLVYVFLAHPKVDIFLDVAFGAVHTDIRFLQVKLAAQHTDYCSNLSPAVEQSVNYICQQCEASLQFLQSLCQQKLFRERLLRNKELCGKGGMLLLARAILKLNPAPLFKESSTVNAAISRLKAKILSILLHLCEAESISYLDEVASSPKSLDLAKAVALEVVELLNKMMVADSKQLSACSRTNPAGLLQLNAMRLADIFSDDSNFRSFITIYFTEVLARICSLPHGDFLSSWCSSDLPLREEDVTLEYDPFAATGWILEFSFPKTETKSDPTLVPNNMTRASYAHQRTSLLVKIIANLHCFVPNICEEQERNLFLLKFLECLQMEQPKPLSGVSFSSDAEKATTICTNLRSLLGHAESLIPNFLNEEDLQLLRVFCNQLQSQISPAESEVNRVQERCSSPLPRNIAPEIDSRSLNLKEEMSENSALHELDQLNVAKNHENDADDIMGQNIRKDEGNTDGQNVETSGSDSSSIRAKNSIHQLDNSDFPKLIDQNKDRGIEGDQEDEKVEIVEKHRRKRKRNIMNEKQIAVIERALLDEPELQRNAVSLQCWADKLTIHGSEVTSSQLKNWLNNRKARLARAAKDVRAPLYDSADSPSDELFVPTTSSRGGTHHNPTGGTHQSMTGTNESSEIAPSGFVDSRSGQMDPLHCGQHVVLLDGQKKEIGKGKVYQVEGKWYDRNIEETCVVDVVELKTERWVSLPHSSEATGDSFDQAELKMGVMRVMWDLDKIIVLQPH